MRARKLEQHHALIFALYYNQEPPTDATRIIITTRSFMAKACAKEANSVVQRLLQSKPRGVALLDEVDEGSLGEMFGCTASCAEMLTARDPGQAMLAGFAPCHNLGGRRDEPDRGLALLLLRGCAPLRLREAQRFGEDRAPLL